VIMITKPPKGDKEKTYLKVRMRLNGKVPCQTVEGQDRKE